MSPSLSSSLTFFPLPTSLQLGRQTPVLTVRGLSLVNNLFGEDVVMLDTPGGRQGLIAKFNL